VSTDAVEVVDLFEHLVSEQASEQVLDQSSQLTEPTVQSQSDFKTDLGADIKVNFKADPKSDMNLGAVVELDVKLGAKLEQSEQLSVVWPDTLSWPEHVLAMPVTGLARQALERTQWNMVQTHSPSSHVVHLYTPIKAYVTSDYEQRLASVLSDYYGADIQVRIVLGEVSHTAQRLNQVQQDQKQRSAVESIEQDPFVLSLQQQLGAQIVPGSIRSLS
jgi:DNA polymerase III tau subunit V interacting with alpha